jgi:mutator protein MutT
VPGFLHRYEEALRQRIAGHLDGFERVAHPAAELRPAAVALVLVADDEDRACFVITRRAADLRSHGGQWALPGGRIDPGESPEQAARRELEEEVCLELPAESVLGLLDDYPTRSGYVITPVVLWAGRERELAPNPTACPWPSWIGPTFRACDASRRAIDR